MMKNYWNRILIWGTALFLPFALLSCSDDDPEPVGAPTVEIIPGEAMTGSLTFSVVASDNADRAAYVCVKKGAQIPAASELLLTGIRVDTPEQTVSNLDPQTSYVIAAVAAAGDLLSGVETVEMTTAKAETPVDAEVTCMFSYGAYFGTDYTEGATTGHYMLGVSNIVTNEQGYATGAGYEFMFSLHSTLASDPDHASPKPGTYEFDGEDSWDEFTFDNEYSNWTATDEDGQKCDDGFMRFGSTVDIEETAPGQYRIEAYAKLSDGKSYKIVYEGPVAWMNRSLSDKKLDAAYAETIYYGTTGGLSTTSDEWLIGLYDRKEDPQMLLTIDLYDWVSETPDNPVFPTGTFVLGRGYEPGTVTRGVIMGDLISGTRLTVVETGQTYPCMEGTVVIDRQGDNYTITCDLTTAYETSVKATYTGTIPIDNRYAGLSDDIDLTCVAANGILYHSKGSGPYDYYLNLYCEGFDANGERIGNGEAYYLEVDLYSMTFPEDLADIIVPEGTFTLSDQYYGDQYYDGDITQEYTNLFYYKEGSDEETMLSFQSCDCTVTHDENGGEVIEFRGVLESGSTVVCRCSGVDIEFEIGQW